MKHIYLYFTVYIYFLIICKIVNVDFFLKNIFFMTNYFVDMTNKIIFMTNFFSLMTNFQKDIGHIFTWSYGHMTNWSRKLQDPTFYFKVYL